MKKLCLFCLLLCWSVNALALEIAATADLRGTVEPCPG